MNQVLAKLSTWELVALLGSATVALTVLFFPVGTVYFGLLGAKSSKAFTLLEGYGFLGVLLLLGAVGSAVAVGLNPAWFRRAAMVLGGLSLLGFIWVLVDLLVARGWAKEIEEGSRLGGNLLGVEAGAALGFGALLLLLGGLAALVGGLQSLRQGA